MPTMPTAIFLIRVARAGGRERARSRRAPYTQRQEGCKCRAPKRANLLLSEPRREVGLKRVLGVNATGLGEELLLGLGVVRVRHAAVDRTDGGALLLIEEADAFGALLGHDVVDVGGQGRMSVAVAVPRHTTFVDRRVRAFGLAGSAVDAFGGDHRGHCARPPRSGRDYTGRRARVTTEIGRSGVHACRRRREARCPLRPPACPPPALYAPLGGRGGVRPGEGPGPP